MTNITARQFDLFINIPFLSGCTGNDSTNLREDFYFANETDVFGPGGSKEPCTETVWKHITSGYSDIPNRMAQAFTKTGGKTFLNHQLLRFERAAGGGYDLLFFQRESGTLTSGQGEARCSADPQSCRTVRASHLVLAIPKRSLELLDRETFFLQDPTVNRLLISSVLDNPALRMFMAYREPWWKRAPPLDKPTIDKACNIPPTCGRSTTDLPVRQFYYWYTAPEGAANQESFVLATYPNAEALAQVLEMGMKEGLTQTLDKLEEVVRA